MAVERLLASRRPCSIPVPFPCLTGEGKASIVQCATVFSVGAKGLRPGILLGHLAPVTSLCPAGGEAIIASAGEDGAMTTWIVSDNESCSARILKRSDDQSTIWGLCEPYKGMWARGCEAGRGA